MAIDLSPPEKELLEEILENELEDIRSEFHHTQAHDYKEGLRAREALVRGLLGRVRS